MSPYLTPGLIVHKLLAWALSASGSPARWWSFGEIILNTFRYEIFFLILWPDLSLHLYTSPHHPAGSKQSKASMLLPTLLWIWIYFERILDLKILIFQRQQYMEQRYMKQPHPPGQKVDLQVFTRVERLKVVRAHDGEHWSACEMTQGIKAVFMYLMYLQRGRRFQGQWGGWSWCWWQGRGCRSWSARWPEEWSPW